MLRHAVLLIGALCFGCATPGDPEPGSHVPGGSCTVEVVNRSGGPLDISTQGEYVQSRGALPSGTSMTFEAPCSLGRLVVTATRVQGMGTPGVFERDEGTDYQGQAEVQNVQLEPGEVVQAVFRRVGARRR